MAILCLARYKCWSFARPKNHFITQPTFHHYCQMSDIKQTTWIHGLSIEIENATWVPLATRTSLGTTVQPSADMEGWVHFAIPTPVVINGVAAQKAKSISLQFSTGDLAKIDSLRVYDGKKTLMELKDLSWTGEHLKVVDVKNTPQVYQGMGISAFIKFTATGPGAWVQLVSAAISFV